MQNNNPYRLPAAVKPKKYAVELVPDFEKFVCAGTETILLDIIEPTKEIKVNAHEVTITSATINNTPAKKMTYDKEKQTASIICKNSLNKGPATLVLSFHSKIREDLRGFYKSTYEVNGQKKILATTQFEATDARRCFPCFDEPSLKATFAITLVIPKNLTAISNMPIHKESTEGNKKHLIFHETPIMSTYLLAFLIGEFEGIQKKTKNNVTVGVWTTPGKKHQGEFALDIAVKILEYYEQYFNIPYPLPKLDLIAIPDFESGAMENWGAITYRETALLFDKTMSSVAARERVAIVVAHELAHQWFGNLVTMEWWNDLWLNEGFASWIEYKAVDHLFPEWEMWVQFYTDDQGSAFSLDGLETSHQIEVPVVNPAEIDEIFDAVSYSKGSSVIRMLEQYLGEDIFRKGLQHYLNAHHYDNATTNDLWNALEKVSGKPVQKIMDSWTKQIGYPLITTTTKEKTIQLQQERYFLSGRKEDPTTWNIPLAITQGKKSFYRLMEKKAEIIPRTPEITTINTNQVGFYRLQYDQTLFQQQLQALQAKKVSTLDKIGLMSNTFALAEARYTDMTAFLNLLHYMRDETNYTLWSDIAGSVGQLQMMFNNYPFADDLDALIRWVFVKIFGKLGWDVKEKEEHTTTLLRITVLSMMGFSNDKKIQAEAQQRFQEYLKTKIINANLRGVVYSLSAWTGNEQTWRQLKQLHEAATLQEEKSRLLGAMCMFQQKEILQRTLEYSLSPAVRPQDSPIGVGRTARNPFGMELAWQFFKDQWPEFNKRYGSGGHLMGRIIQAVSSGFNTQEKADDVKAFFKKHPVPHAKRAIEQSLESIKINELFVQKHENAVASWLKEWKAQQKL